MPFRLTFFFYIRAHCIVSDTFFNIPSVDSCNVCNGKVSWMVNVEIVQMVENLRLYN